MSAAETGGPASFEALRSAGIAALQRLCGAVWTDYNLHDPGVTTFEQLAYGLTDLAYRTGFDMADYLTGADGSIDYAGLALFPPEDVLPCAALTVDDYRRLLYGAIPELADVWIRLDADGLMEIDVSIDGEQAGVAQRVRAVYAANRALGSDLARVRVLQPRAYYLRGEIDTWGERPDAEVLARILFDCGQYLSSGLSAQRLRDVIALGWNPERVYEGPAMRHGHVSARQDSDAGAPVGVSELIGVIQKIDGVRRIRSLAIVDDTLQPVLAIPRDRAAGECPVLPFPHDEVQAELLRVQPEQGIEYGVSEQMIPPTPAWRAANRLLVEEAKLELAKLRFEQRAFRSDEGAGRARYPLPAGSHRPLHDYYSVQHEFPAVYGVGSYGLPHSASEERRAQARQLQGFLYPMEQLMANYLQNLQDFPRLFGVRHAQPRSYGTQYLDGPAVPGVAALYGVAPEDVRVRLGRVLARQDEHAERKGRVYDYLLAIHGESFPQTSLRRFNHYHPDATEAWLLHAKRRLLEALVELGAGRGLGSDYTLPLGEPGARAPLARRCAILLGFDGGERERSLLPRWRGVALDLEPRAEEADAEPSVSAAPGDWLHVPPAAGPVGNPPARLLERQDWLADGLFRDGALLANYRLARSGGEYRLHVQAGQHWRMLGSYGRRDQAVAEAHAAMTTLARLNRRSEGMHIVEHILLRPRAALETQPNAGAGQGLGNPAFYPARISVVLPAWTLRCADRAFRNFVEETVREHCPAHLQPGFLWLGAGHMAQFEQLHVSWRGVLREWRLADGQDQDGLGQALHDAAGALVHFLREHRKEPA